MTARKKIDWGSVAKMSSIIIFALGMVGSAATWAISEVRNSAKMEAEIEYMQKYENVITDNIVLRANCGGDTTVVKHK